MIDKDSSTTGLEKKRSSVQSLPHVPVSRVYVHVL